jgi:ABC-type dipeptide/oligopeptide/nickel transport system permease subunit
VVPAQAPQQGKPTSLWSDAWKELRRKPSFVISAVIIIIMMTMAIVPQLFTSADPRDCNLLDALQPPSAEHWFGFDLQGCDYYARTIYGARNSITIGLVVTLFSTLIAVSLGSLAGYRGGWIDSFLARLADIFFAIPLILAGIVFLNALGTKSVWTVSGVLIVFGWPTMLRLMRSTVLSIRELDYVDAARALGASDWRIITRHVLPNGITPVIVYATITVGVVISAEATLSFLNVGLQLPAISWGLMISVAQNRILEAPHLLLFPGLFLSVTVFSFILMGDALRDALDPKLR